MRIRKSSTTTSSILSLAALLGIAGSAYGQSSSDVRMLIRESSVRAMPNVAIDLEKSSTEKFAIVIGNGTYDTVSDLRNTAADAAAVAGLLRDGGYAVTELFDLSKLGFEAALRQILFDVSKGSDLVIYFAGHGVQIGRENYLIPSDADISSALDVPFEAVSLSSFLAIAGARARSLTVILDSCRNNPFPDQDVLVDLSAEPSAIRTGFTPQDTPINSLVVFSTSPGSVAFDGKPEEDHSPFTQALIDVVAAQPDAPLDAVLKDVRRQVYSATQGQQIPWESSSLVEPVHLTSSAPPLPPAATITTFAPATQGEIRLSARLDPKVSLGAGLSRAFATDGTMAVTTEPKIGRLEVARSGNSHALPQHPVEGKGIEDIVYRQFTPQLSARDLKGMTVSDQFVLTNAAGSHAVTLDLEVDPCDFEAGAYLDPDGVGIARYPNEIEIDKALAACTAAVEREPEVGRFHYQLGRVFLAQKDLRSADRAFRQATELGHTRAWHGRGNLERAKTDRMRGSAPPKARAFYAEGVARGDPYAFHSLGADYLRYGETEAEREQGFDLLSRAVEMGHTFAMNALGSHFMRDRDNPVQQARGIRYFEESAKRGDVFGIYNLARVLRYGRGGAEKDVAEALDLYKRADEGLHPGAPGAIGMMHASGELGPRDFDTAVSWVDKGLLRGDTSGTVAVAEVLVNRATDSARRGDGARFAALAAVRKTEGPRLRGEALLDGLGARDLDAGTQALMAALGAKIAVDGDFGPASQTAFAKIVGGGVPDAPDARLLTLARHFWKNTPFRTDMQ